MILPKIVKSYNQNNHIIQEWDESDCLYDRFIFQSYNTTMMAVDSTGLYFNDNESNYTQTTCKYLRQSMEYLQGYLNTENRHLMLGLLNTNNTKKAVLKYVNETGRRIDD